MTDALRTCPSFGELADYWTPDAAPSDVERIEAHVFACDRCARLLERAERLTRGIGVLLRTGGVQAFVTDGLLNQLARDGVRMRSYALGPGESVRCAVWTGDEVMVTRLRGDFTGVTSVDAEMRLDTGEEWGQASDVPVREGATELVMLVPAAPMLGSPAATMRLTLRASSESGGDRVLGEYVFNHEGTLDRASR